MIYFLRRPGDGAIKIGTTVNLTARSASLRREAGEMLDLLAVMGGGRPEEDALHIRFGDHRRSRRGEWFDPAPALIAFIAEHGRAWDGTDEAPVRVRETMMNLRGMPDWKAIVEEAAEFDRAPSVVDFIDRAIAHYCKAIKFPKPLPKR